MLGRFAGLRSLADIAAGWSHIVGLLLPAVATPPGRVFAIRCERRTLGVGSESRSLAARCEKRVLAVGAEGRIIEVPAETRSIDA